MMTNALQAFNSSSTKRNISENERMISISGGALLVLSGISNIKKSPFSSILKVVAGGFLIQRGTSGHCAVSEAVGRNTATPDAQMAIVIKETVTVNRPKEEVYQYWRKLENLPLFMKHLKEVNQVTPTRSHWEAQINDAVGKLEWDAEIVSEEENEFISWASVPGAAVDNAGEVRFIATPANEVTEVQATISYNPPAGEVGKMAAKLLNGTFASMIREDLRRFKQIMETVVA